jgi:hypothetical protein
MNVHFERLFAIRNKRGCPDARGARRETRAATWLALVSWLFLLVTARVGLAQTGLQGAKHGDGIGIPIYTVQPLRTASGTVVPNDAMARLDTVPTWMGKFRYPVAGVRRVFPFTMVGTSPWAGSRTTTVPTEIIPIALIFSNGVSLDGTTTLAKTVASPLFQPFVSQTGVTQYGDAVSRGSFYSVVQQHSPDWHVLLGQPTVFPTHTITVPAEDGFEFTGSGSGSPIGLINTEWFTQQIRSLLLSLNLDPHTLPIFLTYNSFLFSGNPENCCVIGFHSALASSGPGDSHRVNTFVWASYSDHGIFGPAIEDITALSHEIAEWYHDPLIGNVVPAWPQPGTGACFSNILEVGDAIESFPNLSFVVNMGKMEYHPQDVALFSWFARQSPSIGLEGRYSYRGAKLFGPAPSC